MSLAPLAFTCAALIGFAAYRASLCNVRAVAEPMTAGSAHMLWSLRQAVLLMATLTGALVLGLLRAVRLPMPALSGSPPGCDDAGVR